MKVLSRTLLIIAGVVLLAAIVVLAYGSLEVWKQYIALSANRSMAFSNPVGVMIIGAVLALLAGVFAGYALGRPRQPKQQASQATHPRPPSPYPDEATPPADPTTLR